MFRSENCDQDCPLTAEDRPHVVTAEVATRANELLAEAHARKALAMALQRQVDALEKLKEAAWDEHRDKDHRARRLLLGRSW